MAAAYVTRSGSSPCRTPSHDAPSIVSRSLRGSVVTHGCCPFHFAVCACRPSRNCVPSARPRACQGREPRRGWSEAESLDRIAASRTFAVVMAGVVPFVSFRSGIGRRRHLDSVAVHARRNASRPHARGRAPEEWKRFSAGRTDPRCVLARRVIHRRDLSSPGGHRTFA